MLPFRRYGHTPPPYGAHIDWGKAPPSLLYAVVLGPDSGGPITALATIPQISSPAPFESVQRLACPTESFAPMKHPEGHLWGGTPATQATDHWRITTGTHSVNRITVIGRQWQQTTNGANNGGQMFANSSAGISDVCEAFTPHDTNGDGWMRFGNTVAGQGKLEFTEPSLLTGFHTLMFSASTGVLQPAGMRALMDGGKTLASIDSWSGTKPSGSGLEIGKGFWGLISYVYVFDDYVTDVGFLERFHEQPYYIFAEPAKTFISIPAESSDQGTTDTMLVYDLLLKAWSVWPTQNAVSLFRVRDASTGFEEVFAGGRDGSVRVLNRPSATNAIDGVVQHISALGQQGVEKSIRHIFLYFKETGSYTATVRIYMDFSPTPVVNTTVSMLGSGAAWGVGVWGTGVWGGQQQIIKRLDLTGTGEFMTLEIENDGAGENFTFLGYKVLWRQRRVVRR